jgi:hypothetical protein
MGQLRCALEIDGDSELLNKSLIEHRVDKARMQYALSTGCVLLVA